MSEPMLSADSEVVLLLCGRFGGEGSEPYKPMTPTEYSALAKWLNDRKLRPADLMTESGRTHLPEVSMAKIDRKRLEFLLARGTAMALALERWNRGGLWVISRGDPDYPKRLRDMLKSKMPPLLYGAGEVSLLGMGGLAIVGSRDASESALATTRDVAKQCAREKIVVVSGGAKGVDATSMQAATDAGGCAIGVLAGDLLKACVQRQNRVGLKEGRLVLVSAFYPEAGFSAGAAMERIKYIYTLADRALVIDSALDGGTWSGATEALKEKWVPVHIRMPGNGLGNAALAEKGCIAFTYPADGGQLLSDVFTAAEMKAIKTSEPEMAQASLLDIAPADVMSESPPEQVFSPVETLQADTPAVFSEDGHSVLLGLSIEHMSESKPVAMPAEMQLCVDAPSVPSNSLDMYTEFARKLSLALTSDTFVEEEIARVFGLEKTQVKVWLKRALEEGLVEKLKKPVRYALEAPPYSSLG